MEQEHNEIDSDDDDLIREIDESVFSQDMKPYKRRKIHMYETEISKEYEIKSGTGSSDLKQPFTVFQSLHNPDKGLYPKESIKCFQNAGELLNPCMSFSSCEEVTKLKSVSNARKVKCFNASPNRIRSSMMSPFKQSSPGSILHYCLPSTSASYTHSDSDNNLPMSQPVQSPSIKFTTNQVISISQPVQSTSKVTAATVTKRLFDAQRTLSPTKKLVYTKVKSTRGNKRKEPMFNRDNKFLYSNTHNSDSSDLLSFNIKLQSADNECESTSGETTDIEEYNYFDDMPTEIIENIFCRLPFLDLYLNITRVCVQWNDIMISDKFIPWKKRYYNMKMSKNSLNMKEVYDVMNENGMTSTDSYLIQLVRHMAKYKCFNVKVTKSLLKHKKYSWAVELLKERVPQCVENDIANPWSLITVLCIIASSVEDISEVIHCLLSGDTYIMAIDVIECLYCIASFLLCFKTLKYQDVWTSMHYKVYYALYLFENESSSNLKQLKSVFSNTGQQSLLKYSSNSNLELTHEQMRIVKYEPKEVEIAKIVAFAGTGKTTTLVKYTKLRPNKQFLLVVFNKSVKEHANRMFPPNVTCKTGHGLAFRPVGSRYKNRKFSAYGLKIGNILKVLTARKGISIYVQAKFIQDTLNKFMCSADDFITTAHVPTTLIDDNGKHKDIDHEQRMLIAGDAQDIWNRMIDENDMGVSMVHDGYLKLYQLRKPTLWGYDMILIDEAQDLTPAVYDILMRQKIPKIFVGDPHQQIYSFRGAVNAMNLIQATNTFYLTQSFRFGPEISFVASSALEFLKGEKKRTLVGNCKDSGVMGDTKGQVAVITRTNFVLFGEAVKQCCYNDENIKVAFAGGMDSFGFNVILAIHALMLPPEKRKPHQVKELKSNFVGRFSSIGDLEKYATKTQDNELLGKIRIVKTYSISLPSLIEKIKKKTVSIPQNADVIFSTAHKAKGLEFSTVRLTDDFNVEPHPNTVGMYNPSKNREDEANLLYVAVTRAKKRLVMTPTVMKLLDMSGERFLYPELSKNIEAEGQTFKCELTNREFKPQVLTLVKKKVKLSDGRTRGGGMLCPQVILEEISSLKALYGSLKDERTTLDVEQQENQIEEENRDGWEFQLFEDYDDINPVNLFQIN